MAERNVPGHTQLTRIPSRAYSTAATLASWMTAALVAQYGAACDHAVSPETEAVRMIEPERCGRITADRGPDAVDRAEDVDPEGALPVLGRQVVDAAVRREHAGVADQDVEPAEALDRQRHHRLDLGEVADVGQHRRHRGRVRLRGPPTVAGQRLLGHVAQRRGRCPASPASRRDTAAPSAPPAPVMATTRRVRTRLPSYEQVPAVDGQHGPGDERRGVRGQELVGAGQVGRCAPAAASAVCPVMAVGQPGLRFHPSASGESNHPGATTLTVMPAGARSSASPLASPVSPAFDAL